jgi:hypothetical protein
MTAHVHDQRFDGDDPYLVCACGARWDALTGRELTAGRCDICQRRPSSFEVPVFHGAGVHFRERKGTEHWCDPCYRAVLAKYPHETMWPRYGIWLAPSEIPA